MSRTVPEIFCKFIPFTDVFSSKLCFSAIRSVQNLMLRLVRCDITLINITENIQICLFKKYYRNQLSKVKFIRKIK